MDDLQKTNEKGKKGLSLLSLGLIGISAFIIGVLIYVAIVYFIFPA